MKNDGIKVISVWHAYLKSCIKSCLCGVLLLVKVCINYLLRPHILLFLLSFIFPVYFLAVENAFCPKRHDVLSVPLPHCPFLPILVYCKMIFCIQNFSDICLFLLNENYLTINLWLLIFQFYI